VRGGGISLGLAIYGFVLGSNTIEADFVSGSAGDGIAPQAAGVGPEKQGYWPGILRVSNLKS